MGNMFNMRHKSDVAINKTNKISIAGAKVQYPSKQVTSSSNEKSYYGITSRTSCTQTISTSRREESR